MPKAKPKVTELPKKERKARKHLCKQVANVILRLNRLLKKSARQEKRLELLTAQLPPGALAKISAHFVAQTGRKATPKKVAALVYP